MNGTGFIQTFLKGFWRSFQEQHLPPTRNVILQIVQEGFIGLNCLLHQLTYIFQHTCLKLIVNYCIEQERFSGYYIQSWRKFKDFSRSSTEIKGIFKDFP